MPIPLTPPDDEVGIGIPDYDIIYKGATHFVKVVAHLPFYYYSTMSSYDYVYLLL